MTRLRRLVGIALLAAAMTGCGLEEGIERDELDRVDVPSHLELVAEGQEARFSFRAFATEATHVSAADFEAPGSDYEETDTPGRVVWEGWSPLVTWVGPTPDRKRECVVAVERSTDREILESQIEPEEIGEIPDDARVIRIRASCHQPQHSFD